MAVYTKLSYEIISKLAQEYNLGNLISVTEIAEGIENTNYLIETKHATLPAEKSILTIYENRINTDELPFFLGIMEYLAKNKITCPIPRYTTQNQQTITLDNGKIAAIVTFLDGKAINNIQNKHLESLGMMMAKMHIAVKDFSMKRENSLSISGWKSLLSNIGKNANAIEDGLYNELSKDIEWLEKHWNFNIPKGVIHADLFPDNVFFINDKVSGIIDFYFACNDYFIYDIAITINAWCFDNNLIFSKSKEESLLKGYNKIRKITDDELKALPIICHGAAMRFLLTRIYDKINTPKEALVTIKDPMEYLYKLRFHRKHNIHR